MLVALPRKKIAEIKRMQEKVYPYNQLQLSKPETVANLFFDYLENLGPIEREKEHLVVFGLSTDLKIKFMDVVSVGTLNSSLAHPREIFRPLIFFGCYSFIIAHNHPSGNIEPSNGDDDVTKQLLSAGKIISINLLDSIIVGKKPFYYSYCDAGKILI